MTNTSEDQPNLALLESTLERYGADRTRWPADMRRQLAGLLGTSKEAQCLVSEATALDRLLDMAPSLSDARGKALADRIVSAAKTMPRVVATSAAKRQTFSLSRRENWAAGAALAASLVLGLYAGSQQSVAPTLQEIASAAGFLGEAAQVSDAGDEAEIYSNEDVL